jgi:hypothetical protein
VKIVILSYAPVDGMYAATLMERGHEVAFFGPGAFFPSVMKQFADYDGCWLLGTSDELVVVGRIFKVHAAPEGTSWMWTLAFGHHEDRTPTHGYVATREAAMAAFDRGARRDRPRRRAADQRDELAPFHSITSSASASNLSGICRVASWQAGGAIIL